MNLTQTHIDFWESKQRRPRWMLMVERPSPSVSVDSCINAHAGIKPSSPELATHNLMQLCRRHIGRGTLIPFLLRLRDEPGTLIDPRKRSALAKKWAARLLA